MALIQYWFYMVQLFPAVYSPQSVSRQIMLSHRNGLVVGVGATINLCRWHDVAQVDLRPDDDIHVEEVTVWSLDRLKTLCCS